MQAQWTENGQENGKRAGFEGSWTGMTRMFYFLGVFSFLEYASPPLGLYSPT